MKFFMSVTMHQMLQTDLLQIRVYRTASSVLELCSQQMGVIRGNKVFTMIHQMCLFVVHPSIEVPYQMMAASAPGDLSYLTYRQSITQDMDIM